jgi:hypothetical protein
VGGDGIGARRKATAARVAVLLYLFAVEAQQIGADVVHFVNIVAVFLEAVDQARADFSPSGVWKLAFSTAISSAKLSRFAQTPSL